MKLDLLIDFDRLEDVDDGPFFDDIRAFRACAG